MSFGIYNYNFGLTNQTFLLQLAENLYNCARFSPQNHAFGSFSFLSNGATSSSASKTITNAGSSIFGFLNEANETSRNKIKTVTQKAKNKVSSIKTKLKVKKNALKEAGFLNKVKNLAARINCNYEDLLAVMNAESGLNPHAVNRNGGATGLIQFMPKTAENLGTSTEELSQMSATEQLPFVEKFLKRAKEAAGFDPDAKLGSGELYSLLFLPARARRDVLCQAGERNKNGNLLKYYEANKGTDINGDGKITKSELAQRVERFKVTEIASA